MEEMSDSTRLDNDNLSEAENIVKPEMEKPS